jgi:cation:H+ antiporter
MILDLVLCAVGFVLLYYGAEWLVKGSSNLARALGVAPIVIGLTVVAFGTSAPELVVSLISSIKGKSMIAVGNVFGSNICNIALVLGLAAVLQPITCDRTVVKRDIPIMLLVTILTLGFCLDDRLSRAEGIILFAGIIVYTILNYRFARVGTATTVEIPDLEGAEDRMVGGRELWLMFIGSLAIGGIAFTIGDTLTGGLAVGLALASLFVFGAQEGVGLRAGSRLMMILLVLVGIYGVVQGAQVVVDAAERIMYRIGVDEKFVGLTIVAFGTSLPELATSVVAAMRKEMDISIGNLVGSNVFNLLSVLGIASIVRPIDIPGGFIHSGLIIDGFAMLAVSALPLLFMWWVPTVRRWQGGFLLCCYAAFLTYLILRI